MIIGNTSTMENGLRVSVDWLSFTVFETMDWKNLVERFGISSELFRDGLTGSYGYKSRVRHVNQSISVLYDGNDGMGMHVDVSGSAVGYFLKCYLSKNTACATPFGEMAYECESFDDTVLGDVLKDILDMGQLTRLDLAIDDVGCAYYSLNELGDIFHRGLYTSRFKKFKDVYEGGKNTCSGRTIYLGSRKSELMFRIYDKQLEQNTKKDGNNQTPWTRWEIELHKDRATAVAAFLVGGKSLSETAVGILSNYLRLINSDNVRDSRCSTSPKWLAFLDGISKVRICQPIPEKTLEEKRAWVERQVGPTLAAIYAIDGDLSFYYSIIESGLSRLSVGLTNMIYTAQCSDIP